ILGQFLRNCVPSGFNSPTASVDPGRYRPPETILGLFEFKIRAKNAAYKEKCRHLSGQLRTFPGDTLHFRIWLFSFMGKRVVGVIYYPPGEPALSGHLPQTTGNFVSMPLPE